MIPVTKPFLPPKIEYDKILDQIWEKNWMTNLGPQSIELENQLKEYLNLDHFQYVANGTIALQIAIKALRLSGEIITTPFSYVATTSSIVWEGCKPIFADIDPETFNIDPGEIEKKITPKTSGILATHVFGNPCDIEAIKSIALRYNLKVIYDAAHCFGTKYKEKSVLEYGDLSTISFHATKLFHTVEGGGVIAKDEKVGKIIYYMKNFGHAGPEVFKGLGINGKNSEFHAAMGLVNLGYANDILQKRYTDHLLYDHDLTEISVQKPTISSFAEYNHAYYPIVVESKKKCEELIKNLQDKNIFPRRYFYPVLSELNYVESTQVPVAKDISERILCLPLFFEITAAEIRSVCDVIKTTLKS